MNNVVLLGRVPVGTEFMIPRFSGRSKGPYIKIDCDRFTDAVGREWFESNLGRPGTPVRVVQINSCH